ncbi:MAG: hypothetical protein ACNA7I_09615, partial [Candidatus Methanoperedens sp.]
ARSIAATVAMDTPISIDFFIFITSILQRTSLRPSFLTGETTDTFYARRPVKRLHKSETSVSAK